MLAFCIPVRGQVSNWPAYIKFISNWPVIATRLGDVGYIDTSGIWRQIFNIFSVAHCHALGIEPLHLPKEITNYISVGVVHGWQELPIVRVSREWEYRFLSGAELQMFQTIIQN